MRNPSVKEWQLWGRRERQLKCTSWLPATSQRHPPDISCRSLMTIQQDATPIWTKRIGEDSLAPCALICWLTAERQHCLFNVGRVRGHCIAFVRSAAEVTLSSGPSCCRQLGHATYIESNYPCQLITAQLVPSRRTQNSPLYNECLSVCILVSLLTRADAPTCSESLGRARKGGQQNEPV